MVKRLKILKFNEITTKLNLTQWGKRIFPFFLYARKILDAVKILFHNKIVIFSMISMRERKKVSSLFPQNQGVWIWNSLQVENFLKSIIFDANFVIVVGSLDPWKFRRAVNTGSPTSRTHKSHMKKYRATGGREVGAGQGKATRVAKFKYRATT